MSVPVLRQPHLYHAFISYCAIADTRQAKRIMEVIERRGFNCCFDERDFLPGTCRADAIVEAIHRSKNVILMISPASIQSEWSKFEMLVAVDDSHKRNSVCLVPVLVGGVKVVDLPDPLRLLICIELKDDLQNIEEIIRAISKPEDTWETLLPVGNLAHGFAWGYYYGYLKIILPDLDKKVREWRREHNVEGRMSEKIFLLLPQSCRCKDSISDESPHIRHRGHLPIITQNRAGIIARQYRNTIYSVLDEEVDEEYYFVGEYIGVINTMYQMEQNATTGLQTKEKYIQAMRFYLTIKRILDADPECSSKYKILYYKDEVFLKSASPTTPVVDFMTSEDTEKTSQPIFASIADSGKSNTTSSYPYSDKVTTTQLEVSSFSDEMKYDFETMHEKRLKPTSQEPTAGPNIQGMEFLKNTKLTPELIEVTDKEEMTKSMVCCNPAMKK